jgi:hypothetical protein
MTEGYKNVSRKRGGLLSQKFVFSKIYEHGFNGKFPILYPGKSEAVGYMFSQISRVVFLMNKSLKLL